MAKDFGSLKGNYRGTRFGVIYKDLGLQEILKKVSDFGFTSVRVGIVGPKASDRSGTDGRLSVAEVAMIHILGLAPEHHTRRDFLGAPFRIDANKKRMAFYFRTAAKAVLQLKTSPEIVMAQLGQVAVGIVRGASMSLDMSNGASHAVGVLPLKESTIAKKRLMGRSNARYEDVSAGRVMGRWQPAHSRRVDSPENVLNETGALLNAVSYRVVRTSGSMVDAEASPLDYDAYQIGNDV